MFTQGNHFISLSLSDQELRIAELTVSTASRQILKIARLDLTGVAEENQAHTIAQALKPFSVKKAQILYVAPSSTITTKNIEIPSIKPEEITSIVHLQAGRYTPYSREEIVIGTITIGVYQSNYTKVLLVLANRNVISRKIAILEDAGAEANQVLFAPEGEARFYSRILNLKTVDKPVGIIDIGRDTTDFTVVLRGTAIAYRNIPLGLQALTQEEKAGSQKLAEEISRSVESYQSDDIDQVPGQFVLTCHEERIPGLIPLLKTKLKAEVRCVPYLDHMKIKPTLLAQAADSFHEDSFLDVLAPAIEAEAAELDLMPEEIKLKKSFAQHGREVVRAGVCCFILFFLIGGILLSKVYFNRSYLNKLQTRYRLQREEVDRLRQQSARARLVSDFLDSRQVALKTLQEMYAILPKEIYLTNLNVDEAGVVNIQGVSESMSRVFSLVSTLEDSQLFKGVKTKSTSTKKERGKDMAAFEITLRLEGSDDEKGEEPEAE